MFKRIIVLSDGTGNSAAKVWRTNVWRTFEALDLSGSDQVAFYDDGVGTSSFKPLAILGAPLVTALRETSSSSTNFYVETTNRQRKTATFMETIVPTTRYSLLVSAVEPLPSAYLWDWSLIKAL